MQPKYDWLEPWRKLLQLVNVLVRDGVGALVISAIAHAIEFAISRVEGRPWVWAAGRIELSASDIIHYGDLCIVVAFIGIGIYNLVRRMAKDE